MSYFHSDFETLLILLIFQKWFIVGEETTHVSTLIYHFVERIFIFEVVLSICGF